MSNIKDFISFETGTAFSTAAEAASTNATGAIVSNAATNQGVYSLSLPQVKASYNYYSPEKSSTNYIVMGCFVKFSGTFPPSATVPNIDFLQGASGGVYHIAVRLTGTHLKVLNRSGTVLDTGTATIAVDTWYRVEIRWSYSASSNWELRLNGVSELTGSAADFSNPSGSSSIGVGLVGQGGSGTLPDPTTVSFDSVYYKDNCADSATEFLGNWGTATYRIGKSTNVPDCDSTGGASFQNLNTGVWQNASENTEGTFCRYGATREGAVALDDTGTYGVPGPDLALSRNQVIVAAKWTYDLAESSGLPGTTYVIWGCKEGTTYKVNNEETDVATAGYWNDVQAFGVDFPKRYPTPDDYFVLGFQNTGASGTVTLYEGWCVLLLVTPIATYTAPTVLIKGGIIKGGLIK